jgi:hypothetical protein
MMQVLRISDYEGAIIIIHPARGIAHLPDYIGDLDCNRSVEKQIGLALVCSDAQQDSVGRSEHVERHHRRRALGIRGLGLLGAVPSQKRFPFEGF